ncbi:MAG: hypothetical protein AAE985_07435 [Thermoplasmataceae archaeon]|jgi:hypothetical protein
MIQEIWKRQPLSGDKIHKYIGNKVPDILEAYDRCHREGLKILWNIFPDYKLR